MKRPSWGEKLNGKLGLRLEFFRSRMYNPDTPMLVVMGVVYSYMLVEIIV